MENAKRVEQKEVVKSCKELLLEKNWLFDDHAEANKVGFNHSIAYPEYKFSVVKRGEKYFVGIREGDKGEYLNS